MSAESNQHLQIPKGTERFSLDEAYRHRQIVRAAEDLFSSWGYRPVELPFVDYFDGYRTLVDDSTLASVYRLIDRDGDLLMRSDVTMFLARHIGAHAGDAALPLRVSYADTILRHQESEDISHNEFFQLGAELIGNRELRADIEVATLLGELISLLKLDGCVFHVGSRALFETLCPTDRAVTDRAATAGLIRQREWDALESVMPSAGLFRFIGSTDDLTRLIGRAGDVIEAAKLDDAVSILQDLHELGSTIERVGVPFEVRIDLSEIGAQPYYTGAVFSVYSEGVATAVASGGRYDDLLGHFGPARPSVGFSLMLRKIQDHIGDQSRFDPPEVERVASNHIEDDIAKARTIRSDGKSVTL